MPSRQIDKLLCQSVCLEYYVILCYGEDMFVVTLARTNLFVLGWNTYFFKINLNSFGLIVTLFKKKKYFYLFHCFVQTKKNGLFDYLSRM